MRWWLLGLLIIAGKGLWAQPKTASFSTIDWHMQQAEAPTPDSLARLIAARYTTELEKVRAVYSWITSHISYNTSIYKPRSYSIKYRTDPMDTAAVWPSGDEMMARKVMLRGEAVCEGYAKLFKVVCNYLGVETAIVHGYARGGIGDRKFRTNHTWNAVRVDSAWHLIDVTWAAGYLDWLDNFIPSKNDHYFLSPPEVFIRDHYPEELRWTLLPKPPGYSDFKSSPFRSKNFIKYGIDSFTPSTGLLEAAVGDTLHFSFQLKDVARSQKISSDPFVDTGAYALWPLSAFVRPSKAGSASISFSYIVQPSIEWVNLLYNDDVVLRYRVDVRPRKEETTVEVQTSYFLFDRCN